MTNDKVNVGEVSKKGKMKEGLYTTGNAKDFESVQEIRHNLRAKGELREVPEKRNEIIKKDWPYWSKRFIDRNEVYQEGKECLTGEVKLPRFDAKAIMIANIADLHAGGDCDYKRIELEATYIYNTDNSYVFGKGDWIDGFFWSQPMMVDAIEQVPAQANYMRELIKYYAEKRKILVSWLGDHDGDWQERVGMSPYIDMTEKTGMELRRGPQWVTIPVGDQVYLYKGAHKLLGSSIYNPCHAGVRHSREGSQEADIIDWGHAHRKGHMDRAVKSKGGSHIQHLSCSGPYKYSDSWTLKNGFERQDKQQMFGNAYILWGDKKRIEYFDDIVEATERVKEINSV